MTLPHATRIQFDENDYDGIKHIVHSHSSVLASIHSSGLSTTKSYGSEDASFLINVLAPNVFRAELSHPGTHHQKIADLSEEYAKHPSITSIAHRLGHDGPCASANLLHSNIRIRAGYEIKPWGCNQDGHTDVEVLLPSRQASRPLDTTIIPGTVWIHMLDVATKDTSQHELYEGLIGKRTATQRQLAKVLTADNVMESVTKASLTLWIVWVNQNRDPDARSNNHQIIPWEFLKMHPNDWNLCIQWPGTYVKVRGFHCAIKWGTISMSYTQCLATDFERCIRYSIKNQIYHRLNGSVPVESSMLLHMGLYMFRSDGLYAPYSVFERRSARQCMVRGLRIAINIERTNRALFQGTAERIPSRLFEKPCAVNSNCIRCGAPLCFSRVGNTVCLLCPTSSIRKALFQADLDDLEKQLDYL